MGELLDKSLIEVGVDADSWEDIISYGSELLLKKGNVKEGYKETEIRGPNSKKKRSSWDWTI